MKKESLRVFLASALGGGIGAFLALDLMPRLWWLGLVTGGLTGYVSYRFMDMLRAIRDAWRQVFPPQKPPGWWRSYVWTQLHYMNLVLWACMGIMLFVVVPITAPANKMEPGLETSTVWILFGSCCLVMALINLPFSALTTNDEVKKGTLKEYTEECRLWTINTNPVGIVFRCIVFSIEFSIAAIAAAVPELPSAIRSLLRWFARTVMNIPRFIWLVFLKIHNEVRLLCGVDAFIGAGAGFLMGSALIGAVVGGLLGLLNYALVTERWLRPRGYLEAIS